MKFIKRPGFTLIEGVMIFTLLAIVGFGMSAFIIEAMQGWVIVAGREASIGNIRRGMDRMTSDLRRVKKPNNILTMEASSIGFLDLTSNTITFRQSGTDLLRNSDILVTGLISPEGLLFTYLGATGEVVTTKQAVRSIRVRLSLGSGPQIATLESVARLRNL